MNDLKSKVQRSTRWRAQIVLLMLISALAAACASGREPESAQPAPDEPVYLHAVSYHSLDLTLYLVRDGAWSRLGMVSSCGELEVELNSTLIATGTIRIGVDPIGSRGRYLLGPILFGPGQTIDLTIENYLPLSFWMIRWRHAP